MLGDLSQTQFTRMMLAITQWVAPEQGCTYCHGAAGFADDGLYTKRVARWMIQMTRHINNDWKQHVANTGVTCNTCHRGNNVPQYVWFEPELTGAKPGSNAMLGYYKQLYGPSRVAGWSSLSMDPFSPYLDGDAEIRVVSDAALPTDNHASTKQTEQTYALMMHMSTALGVNCTYCHNTRAFTDWTQSPPARATAWYGIRMVRDINTNYLEPIASVFPPYRLGPHRDVPKTNCTTCHQNLAKPLNGVSMLPDYPSLAYPNVATLVDLLPGTLEPMEPQAATPAAANASDTAVVPQNADPEAAVESSEAAATPPGGTEAPAAPATPAASAAPATPAAPADGSTAAPATSTTADAAPAAAPAPAAAAPDAAPAPAAAPAAADTAPAAPADAAPATPAQ